VPVAAIVAEAHEQGIAAALQRWTVAGLTGETLEPILIYCAERRCEADGAVCPGCRLGTEKLGIRTLDEFVDHHAAITFENSSIRLQGSGTGSLTLDSLEALTRTWAGEEYWFWARRVIRKLRQLGYLESGIDALLAICAIRASVVGGPTIPWHSWSFCCVRCWQWWEVMCCERRRFERNPVKVGVRNL